MTAEDSGYISINKHLEEIDELNNIINRMDRLIKELRKQQLLSEKEKCEWFYKRGIEDGGTIYAFEIHWNLWIDGSHEAVLKKREIRRPKRK